MTTDLFVPPAAEGLPLPALDSATQGADALDAYARTPQGRNLLAHALVQLARDGWLRPEPGEGFEAVRERPTAEPQPSAVVSSPPATDRATDRERIAEALYRHEWPHKQIWQQALAMDRETFLAQADAVLAVLPPPTDRGAIRAEAFREAAAATRRGAFADTFDRMAGVELRRLADEAQQQPTDADVVEAHDLALSFTLAAEAQPEPACTDPIECSHEAALGQAEETLEVLHALGTAWSRPTMSAPTRVAGEHLLRVLGAAPDGVPAAGVRQPDTETPVPCSWVAVRSSHSPHDWQPQPGMDPVHCPGYRRPPMDPVHILGIEADQPAVPQRPYPDCERCGDSGTDPEQPGQPCPECQRPAADDSGEEA